MKNIKKYIQIGCFRFKKIFSLKSPIVISIVMYLYLIHILDIYKDFSLYEDLIIDLLKNVIFTFVGLIGLLLTTLIFFLGLMDKNVKSSIENIKFSTETIKKYNLSPYEVENPIKSIFDSFQFVAEIIALVIILGISLMFLICSSLPKANKLIFKIITWIFMFLFFIIIINSVNLLKQSYRMYSIVIVASDKIEKEKIIKTMLSKIKKDYEKIVSSREEFNNDDYFIGLIHFINKKEGISKKNKALIIELLIEGNNLDKEWVDLICDLGQK